jgi:hypothetical protein
MKKVKNITNRGRKTLSMIFRGISVSVASLILQACYGILPPDDGYAEYGMPAPSYGMPPLTTIQGKVRANKTGEPIFGIKVSIEETEHWDYTNKYGDFNFYLPVQDDYKIKLEDVDGPAHGGLFREKILTLKQDDTYTMLWIGMDIDTE